MIENFDFKTKYSVEDLIEIIRLLRTPDGCPWDREQTHQSIKKNLIEETYEVVEAINKDDPELLKEELGDVFMQVLLHAQMESEKGTFCFDDVANELAQKLIVRHPHVFSTEHCETPEEVLEVWESVKNQTKCRKTVMDSILSVPQELPALMRAQKVQKKAAKAGFDWDEVGGALERVRSECDELEEAIFEKSNEDAVEELGDLLFSCVNVARFIHCDAEESLNGATQKFINRFSKVVFLAKERNIDMNRASLEVLDELWEEVKTLSD